jgi:hypothetical protein
MHEQRNTVIVLSRYVSCSMYVAALYTVCVCVCYAPNLTLDLSNAPHWYTFLVGWARW